MLARQRTLFSSVKAHHAPPHASVQDADAHSHRIGNPLGIDGHLRLCSNITRPH